MERLAEQVLHRWLDRRRRKPLVLRGARQVGKTTLVRQFAAASGMGLCEVNLERNLYLDRVFKSLDVARITRELEAVGGVRLAGSILFLDEVQAAPHALQALRYLYEDRPELPVLAAGSLLEFTLADHPFSMPVGRIEYLHLGPMSYSEFLNATDPVAAEQLAALDLEAPLAEAAHRRQLRRCREYLLVGGLPEAVLAHGETAGSPLEVAAVHRSIAETYQDDFTKYAGGSQLVRLQRLFRSIPGSVGRKVAYHTLDADSRSGDVRDAVELLVKARICHRVIHSHCSGLPLGADIDHRTYKLLFMDVGLMNHVCGVDGPTVDAMDDTRLVNESSIAEQYVGQELAAIGGGERRPDLHYWLRQARKGNAEVDYVISRGDWIIPIKVKAGRSGSMKSLLQFAHEKQPPLAVRFDTNPPSLHTIRHTIRTADGLQPVTVKLLSLPLYAVDALPRLIDQLRTTKHASETADLP